MFDKKSEKEDIEEKLRRWGNSGPIVLIDYDFCRYLYEDPGVSLLLVFTLDDISKGTWSTTGKGCFLRYLYRNQFAEFNSFGFNRRLSREETLSLFSDELLAKFYLMTGIGV